MRGKSRGRDREAVKGRRIDERGRFEGKARMVVVRYGFTTTESWSEQSGRADV